MSILGTSLLGATLVFSLAGVLLWGRASRAAGGTGDGSEPPSDSLLVRRGRRATLLAFAGAAAAVAVLEVALLRRDTSLEYVEKVVDPAMPVYYRFTSLWSAMEGSLLLWLLCLGAVAVVFVTRSGLPPALFAGASAALCAAVAAFAVVALVASPFLTAAEASTSPPSPLLQDHPAMGVHPPLLYAGFAGLAVPYALSIGALLTRTSGVVWSRAVRGWTLAAWIPLTAGIVLGAWWSYAVLGWGGYWAWDPVENASLMPWLLATALLHALGARGRARGEGRLTSGVLLAGAPFLFVLLATFLTRSGTVQSIHAFSVSPLGPLLLGILVTAVLTWGALAVGRRGFLRSSPPAPLLSQQTVLQANGVLLVLITAIVLAGSVLPAVLLAMTGDRLSVGPPWYGRTLAPLALALLVLMAVGPWLSWAGDTVQKLTRRLQVPAVAAAVASGGTGLLVPDFWLAVTAGLAMFVLASLVLRPPGRGRRNRRGTGALLAHLGVAVGAVAVVAGGHAAVTEQTVPVGDTVVADATSATLVGVERHDDGRRTIAEARMLLAEDGASIGEAGPQLRWYEQQGAMLAGPDIKTGPFRDVYLTLLDVDPAAGTATVRLAVNPLISWLWAAGALTVAGAVVAAWPHRRRPATAAPPGRTHLPVPHHERGPVE